MRRASTIVSALTFVAANAFVAAPHCAGQPTLAGHHTCTFVDYAWPESLDDAPRAGGRGTVEYDADAAGKIISGAMTIHAADDTHTLGQNRCDFDLASGSYNMVAPNAGTTTIAWKLRADSDAHCGAYVRNSENLGYVQSARDAAPISHTVSFFLDSNGRSHFSASSPDGVEVGTCDTAK